MINSFYIQRINKVIDHIEENLPDKLTLGKLAMVARFSKYHFHRIFKAVTGETLNQYVKRLRMEKAFRLLSSDPGKSVGDVSIALGYQSNANFSRDFHDFYGYSPTAGRQSKTKPIERKLASGTDMNLTFRSVEYVPDQRVIYTHINSGYKPELISAAFSRLFEFVQKNGLLQSIEQSIGIGYDDPDYTPPDKCRYDACISIGKDTILPENLLYNTKTLKGGKYVVFSFSGKKEALFGAWDHIFKEWLLNSPYLPDDRPHLEMYRLSNDYEKGIFEADLCLPVQPHKLGES